MLLILVFSALPSQGGVLDNTMQTGDNLFKTEPLIIIGSGVAGSLICSAMESGDSGGFLSGDVFTILDETDDILFGPLLPASAASVWAAGALSGSSSMENTGEALCRGLLYSYGITGCLKYAVGRERPDESDNLSFPSAHAAGAACTAAVLWADHGPSAGIPAGILALYTCLSRVNLRRHYPADVLMGAAIGTACGIAAAEVGSHENTESDNDRVARPLFTFSLNIDSSGRIYSSLW